MILFGRKTAKVYLCIIIETNLFLKPKYIMNFLKKTIAIVALFAFCSTQAQVAELEKWLGNNSCPGKVQTEKFAAKGLTKHQAKQAQALITEAWLKHAKEKYAAAWKAEKFVHGDLEMLFTAKIYGKAPANGRSLYISMHGGGATAHKFNDGQWNNQKRLYTPAEGVYVAPRAPWDDWNMWFKPGLDEFFEDLIKAAVAIEGVNPDKVYVMGYSAGGDGVWRMAPRMADSWAAASMMAGHPGEASQVNLRNVPFMIWMGGEDAAYKRNKLAAVKGAVMDSLEAADPSGYVHQTHILPNKPHWMDRADTAAVAWMASKTRNPYPHKVVWRQEEVVRPHMYWLSVDTKTAKQGMTVRAQINGNKIIITECDYPQITINLNDCLVNLDKDVEIVYGDKTVFKGKLQRTIATMAKTACSIGDIRYIYSATKTVQIK